MKTFEIKHEVGIKTSPEKLYYALTDTKALAQWWTSDTRGSAALNGTLEFWFGEFCQKMTVVSLTPESQVRWLVSPGGLEEWAGTEIEFTLVSEEEQISLRFRHSGWRDDEGMFAHCSTKWAVFLLSLKELLETGKGRPHPNDWQINHY